MREFTPEAARRLGVGMIFQEMSLIPTLTVAQNIFLTREPRAGGIFLDDRAANARARALLAQLGVDVDPRAPVSRLSTGQKQMTEIAKAISQDARVLIMDEPTSALSTAEVDRLFTFVEQIRRDGIAVLYVSHKMDEIRRIADTVTILRDGQHVITRPLEGMSLEEIIEHIVGKRVNAFAHRARRVDRSGPPLLRVRGLTGEAGKPLNVSFSLHAGEILGIAGLLGAGRSELARSIAGIERVRTGEVRVHERRIPARAPTAAIAAGIALIPEDRRTQGLILEHSIAANISLPTIDRLSSGGFVRERRARAQVDDLIGRLRIKAGSPQLPVRTLSGGNQQKVVLAKWLAASPNVLILDEPTAGVDIGSKGEIVELIRSLADSGKGVIIMSSELAELLSVSDRILVMSAGRVVREIERGEIESWIPPGTDAADQISHTEQGLQRAIQEAQAPGGTANV
ncbi:MAG: sugar ABC transporter ATP-binding protein [Acetobacteraceae bacterium]|nr:sugar ABC transporter ATP-binding protein [Acetobacteraceae bacterium]